MFTTLPFIVCLCWLVFLLLEWRRESESTHQFVLFVALSTLLYLCHAIFFSSPTEISRYTDVIYSFCNLAVFPAYYLYICRLTQARKITRRQWLLLLPALLVGLWSAVCLLYFPCDAAMESCRILTAKTIFVLQVILVTYYGWKKINKFDHRIMQLYADTEHRKANMTSHILFILSGCALLSMIFSYIGREYFVDNKLSLYIPSTMFSICLYAICYIGYRQTLTADDIAKDEATVDLPDNLAEENADMMQDISDGESLAQIATTTRDEFERVCAMIEDNQWFLKYDLRLTELSQLVGMGRTRLSTLINEKSGMSFSDFINKYRVEYACRILNQSESEKDLVLAIIGEQCGFMSECAFYRNFKKFTGLTPAQYRKR